MPDDDANVGWSGAGEPAAGGDKWFLRQGQNQWVVYSKKNFGPQRIILGAMRQLLPNKLRPPHSGFLSPAR